MFEQVERGQNDLWVPSVEKCSEFARRRFLLKVRPLLPAVADPVHPAVPTMFSDSSKKFVRRWVPRAYRCARTQDYHLCHSCLPGKTCVFVRVDVGEFPALPALTKRSRLQFLLRCTLRPRDRRSVSRLCAGRKEARCASISVNIRHPAATTARF